MGLGLTGLSGLGGLGGGVSRRPVDISQPQGALSSIPVQRGAGRGFGFSGRGGGGGGGDDLAKGISTARQAIGLGKLGAGALGYGDLSQNLGTAGGALGVAGGLYNLASGKEVNPYQLYQTVQAAQGLMGAGAGAGTAAGTGAGTAAAGTAAASLPASYFMGPIGAMIAYSGLRDATEARNMFEGANRTRDRLLAAGLTPEEFDIRKMFGVSVPKNVEMLGGEGSDSTYSARSRPVSTLNQPYWDYLRNKYADIDTKIGMHDLEGDFRNIYGGALVNQSPELQAWMDAQNVYDNSGGG